jgi:TolB-like protein
VAAAILLLMVVAGYYLFRSGPVLDPSKASIGVIPFRNNTGDASMNHYGVGIASEVSTQLGLTKQFDFISSLQATIQYQQSDKSPETIGQELGVTHILTGMYQTAGDNIQVLVELVDVSGKVIWSIPYKTKYNDIFDVQANIAKRVMDKFAVKNVGETPIATPNLEAYAHTMKGYEITMKSNLPEDRMKAITEYQQAIALDSSFIEPWWGIIEEYCYYYWNRNEEMNLTLEMIQPYMQYVQENFPDNWKKKSVMGTYEYWALAHYQKGLDLFQEALQEAPQDGGIHSMAAAILRRQLKLSEALDHISVSLKQNPGGVIFWNELVALMQVNGDYDNAIKAASTIYNLNESLDGNLYRLRLWDGSLDQLPEAVKERRRHTFLADQLLQARDIQGLLSLMDSTPDSLLAKRIRMYYRVIGNYLLKRDDQVRKLGAEYLKLDDGNLNRKSEVLAILGKEEEFRATFFLPLGRSMEEDLTLQWSLESEMLNFQILSGNYPDAVQRLKQINEHFPQVGDYGWLNLPIYDRIKKEHPAFAEAVSQLKLPPRIMDSKIIKM